MSNIEKFIQVLKWIAHLMAQSTTTPAAPCVAPLAFGTGGSHEISIMGERASRDEGTGKKKKCTFKL